MRARRGSGGERSPVAGAGGDMVDGCVKRPVAWVASVDCGGPDRAGGAVSGCGGLPGRTSGGQDNAVIVDVDVDDVRDEEAGDGGIAMAFWV